MAASNQPRLSEAENPLVFMRVTDRKSRSKFNPEFGFTSYYPSKIAVDWPIHLTRQLIIDHLDNRTQSPLSARGNLMSFYANHRRKLPANCIRYAAERRDKLMHDGMAEDPDVRIYIFEPSGLQPSTEIVRSLSVHKPINFLKDKDFDLYRLFSAREAVRVFGIRREVEANHWLCFGQFPWDDNRCRIQIADGRILPLGRPFKLVPTRDQHPPNDAIISREDDALQDIQPIQNQSISAEDQRNSYRDLCIKVGVFDAEFAETFHDWNLWRFITRKGRPILCRIEDCDRSDGERSDRIVIASATQRELEDAEDLSFYIDVPLKQEVSDRSDNGVQLGSLSQAERDQVALRLFNEWMEPDRPAPPTHHVWSPRKTRRDFNRRMEEGAVRDRPPPRIESYELDAAIRNVRLVTEPARPRSSAATRQVANEVSPSRPPRARAKGASTLDRSQDFERPRPAPPVPGGAHRRRPVITHLPSDRDRSDAVLAGSSALAAVQQAVKDSKALQLESKPPVGSTTTRGEQVGAGDTSPTTTEPVVGGRGEVAEPSRSTWTRRPDGTRVKVKKRKGKGKGKEMGAGGAAGDGEGEDENAGIADARSGEGPEEVGDDEAGEGDGADQGSTRQADLAQSE